MNDPAPSERVYYESKQTGDRGYVVEREGKKVIRLDRANIEVLRPLSKDWKKVDARRPITKGQVGLVAFEADKALCRALGLHDAARRDWLRMSVNERSDFMSVGPIEDPLRYELWEKIMGVLRSASE